MHVLAVPCRLFVCTYVRTYGQTDRQMDGSEIWGTDKLKYDSTFKFNNIIEPFACDKTNVSFSKLNLS